MTFHDWQQLSPPAAAREVHRRIQTLLTPPQRRAVIASLPEETMLTAAFSHAKPAGLLAGVPYLLKDLFDVAGLPTLAGSTFLPEVRSTPGSDSMIVTALAETGAVFVGKTHLHEFAYGVTGENPHYGDCEHPHFHGRTTGGSSSGSAAAVAAGVVPFAIGTDTGGSVRVPAAFCGLYGFRLTPGDRFIADAFPLARSFDTAGWFTANATDMRCAVKALIGPETNSRSPHGLYLEMPGLDADVASACGAAAMHFSAVAASDQDGRLLDGFSRSSDIYNTIVANEAWLVHQSWAARYESRYDPAVWQRLNRIHEIDPKAVDQAYADMSAVRTLWTDYFRDFDFLMMAASPFAALTKAECTLTNRSRILQLTAPASLGGLPTLTIPVPLPSGLTTGLQIIVNDPRSPVISWALELARACEPCI